MSHLQLIEIFLSNAYDVLMSYSKVSNTVVVFFLSDTSAYISLANNQDANNIKNWRDIRMSRYQAEQNAHPST